VVSTGSRGTTLSGVPKSSHHPASLSAHKRKANELVNSGAQLSLPVGAQLLALGARLCPHLLQSPVNKLP
jgi:hypothetical protein